MVFAQLEKALAAITGFPGVSLQPNAGSQGELAGLLVIRQLPPEPRPGPPRRLPDPLVRPRHQPRLGGDGRLPGGGGQVRRRRQRRSRPTCEARAAEHRDRLAALMITYPSTHGVFEEDVKQMCAIVHAPRRPGVHGRRQPERPGRACAARPTSAPTSATSTCTRPSASPTAAAARAWAPSPRPRTWRRFLPGHPVIPTGGSEAIGPISAAPWGSASILLISWAYIRMMGGDGLTRATERGHPERQLHRRAAGAALPGVLPGQARPGGARVHLRSAASSRRAPASRPRTWPSG